MAKNNQLDTWLPPNPVTGRRESASYQTTPVKSYQNNPLIEALPSILDEEEVAQALRRPIEYDTSVHNLKRVERIHSIYDILDFFEPLPVHIDLEQSLSIMLRHGLSPRNFMLYETWNNADDLEQRLIRAEKLKKDQLQKLYGLQDNTNLTKWLDLQRRRSRSTLLGQALIGHSGLGKSVSVESILDLYPQVISHREYQGIETDLFQQIVWVHLQCSYDGSIKSLCLQFFEYIDNILGTTYLTDFGKNGTISAERMMPKIARVVALHAIGIIVIDELQNLNAASSGGILKMMNFIMNLINIVRVPVLLIGTPEALPIVTGAFRLARRTMPIMWDRLKNDELWTFFLEGFWDYQYTLNKFPLTEKLSDQLYFETQGIHDLAVKLFVMSQVRAIRNGEEIVTEDTLHNVAQVSFYALQPMLDDYRAGKTESSHTQYLNIDVRLFIEEEAKRIKGEIFSMLREQRGQVLTGARSMMENDDSAPKQTAPLKLGIGKAKSSGKTSKKSSKQTALILPNGLLDVFQQAEENNQSKYDALKAAGYIGSLDEFLN